MKRNARLKKRRPSVDPSHPLQRRCASESPKKPSVAEISSLLSGERRTKKSACKSSRSVKRRQRDAEKQILTTSLRLPKLYLKANPHHLLTTSTLSRLGSTDGGRRWTKRRKRKRRKMRRRKRLRKKLRKKRSAKKKLNAN